MHASATDFSLTWTEGSVVVVDQRKLPREMALLQIRTVDEMIGAIRTLAIRGAPAIGIAGAFGVALSVQANTDASGSICKVSVRTRCA
jgi:methylthioribose-1-phosphate isomerase